MGRHRGKLISVSVRPSTDQMTGHRNVSEYRPRSVNDGNYPLENELWKLKLYTKLPSVQISIFGGRIKFLPLKNIIIVIVLAESRETSKIYKLLPLCICKSNTI